MIRPSESPAPAATPRPFAWARWVLSAVLLALVVGMLYQQWETTRAQALVIAWPWLGVAAIGLAAYYVLAAEAWRRWLALLGAPIAYRDAFRVLYLSNVAKYLPGGAWNYVDRALLLAPLGVDGPRATGSMVLDLACQLASALLVGQLALVGGAAPGWGLAVAAAIVGAMHPRVLNAALAAAAKLLKRPEPSVPYAYRAMLAQLALYTLNWAALAASFAALATALLPHALSARQLLALAGSFPMAWAVGTLALFVPAGLGVREASLVWLLHPVLPGAWPAVLAIVARLWLLVGEAAGFGLALASRR